MPSSARNQFPGTVLSVKRGSVDAAIEIDIGNGTSIISVITNGSVERLGLEPGKSVIALVKASSVILAAADSPPTSSRNRLCGTVSACREGAVNGEVTVELNGGSSITAIITNESIRNMGLGIGAEVCALVKAINVIIAIPAA